MSDLNVAVTNDLELGDFLHSKPVGDWDVRTLDPEQVFALNPLPDDCIDAALRANRAYVPEFPGWELYCKVIRGDDCFDRKLIAWALTAARLYTRTVKANGHPVVARDSRRNEWIRRAALDALEVTILGYSIDDPVHLTAADHAVAQKTYRRVRKSLAALMKYGLSLYEQELHYQYNRVKQENRGY